jgi:zinc transport system permease protein
VDLTLTWQLFGPALVATLAAGLLCPWVGAGLFLRRAAFHGVALPQVAAAAVALGLLLWPHLAPGRGLVPPEAPAEFLLGCALLALAAVLLGLAGARRARSDETARVAAVFAVASAATTLLALYSPLGGERVEALLRGELLALDWGDALLFGGGLSAVAAALWSRRRELLLAALDPEGARVLGHSLRRLEWLWLGAVGATVALGATLAGPVVLFGLLVLPPLAARSVARSMRSFLAGSSALGLASAAAGLWLSFGADWPLGPSVVVAAAGLGALVAAPNLLRRR